MEVGGSWTENQDHIPDEVESGLVVKTAESSSVQLLAHDTVANSPIRCQRHSLESPMQKLLGPGQWTFHAATVVF